MKTVLFALNGSYSHTNLAVRAIGACLTQSGIQTCIIEKSLKDTRLSVLESLVRESADVYGFSVYIWNVSEMMQFASELKVLLPNTVIVFGGPEVSFEDESFFEAHPYIDYLIAGEGEDAFPMLCHSLEKGEMPPKIIMAYPYEKFTEGGIFYDEIGDKPKGLVYYESVRGCPFSCAYCLSSVHEGMRAKSVEKTLYDLLQFEQFDGIRTVKLVDRTFNFDRKRANVLWKTLSDEQYTKEYHFEVSAALLDEEAFSVLEQVPKGKFRLEIGVQSTNSATVMAIDRRLDTEKTLLALQRLHQKGNLHLHADLIAGLPYEDFQTFATSFDDVYGICDVLQLGFLKLLKGSKMRREASKYGIVYSPFPPYQVVKTDVLSFEEIMMLHAVDALNDRFSNSGKFSYTFPYLPLASGSPFRFFEGLAHFAEERYACKEISKLAQVEAFRLIFDYADTLKGLDMTEAAQRLALDFLLGETRRLPDFLHTDTVTAEEKREVLSHVDAKRRAGCEVVRFSFLGDGFYIVDRVNRAIFDFASFPFA